MRIETLTSCEYFKNSENNDYVYKIKIPSTEVICLLLNIVKRPGEYTKFFKYKNFIFTKIKSIALNSNDYDGILYDLQMYPYNLKNVIQFLYKYQNIYVKRLKKDIMGNLTNIGKDNIGKTKTITLKQALQLVKLPSFTSNKMITLSTHKIDKSSFQTYELDLLDTIEDYYKGYCPKKLMIKKLKDYPYSIQPIIQYLYK